jgi:hypothetical protein
MYNAQYRGGPDNVGRRRSYGNAATRLTETELCLGLRRESPERFVAGSDVGLLSAGVRRSRTSSVRV